MAVLTCFLQVFGVLGIYIFDVHYFVMTQVFFSTFFQLNGQPIEDHSALLMVLVKSKIQDFFHDEMGQYRRYSSPSFQFLCSFRLPSLRVIYPKYYKIFVCSATKNEFQFWPKKVHFNAKVGRCLSKIDRNSNFVIWKYEKQTLKVGYFDNFQLHPDDGPQNSF